MVHFFQVKFHSFPDMFAHVILQSSDRSLITIHMPQRTSKPSDRRHATLAKIMVNLAKSWLTMVPLSRSWLIMIHGTLVKIMVRSWQDLGKITMVRQVSCFQYIIFMKISCRLQFLTKPKVYNTSQKFAAPIDRVLLLESTALLQLS